MLINDLIMGKGTLFGFTNLCMDINNVKKPTEHYKYIKYLKMNVVIFLILSILEGIQLFLFWINLIFCINYLSIEMNEIWIIDKYARIDRSYKAQKGVWKLTKSLHLSTGQYNLLYRNLRSLYLRIIAITKWSVQISCFLRVFSTEILRLNWENCSKLNTYFV